MKRHDFDMVLAHIWQTVETSNDPFLQSKAVLTVKAEMDPHTIETARSAPGCVSTGQYDYHNCNNNAVKV